MTPTEALAQALHDGGWVPEKRGCLLESGEVPLTPGAPYTVTVIPWHDCEFSASHWREANDLVVRLEALGFTVARTQDAADGEALRAMDEAFPAGYTVDRWNVEGIGSGFHVHAEDWDSMPLGCGNSGTFSDACRAAIEATR